MNPGPINLYPIRPLTRLTAKFKNEVKSIAKKCPGCNFGSFPEMTLSARSLPTIFERLKLQFKAQSKGIRPLSEEELFGIIDDVKKKYGVYKTGRVYPHREGKVKA